MPADDPEQYLVKCPKCGCEDLYLRKDFPRLVALAIVIGAGLSFITLAGNPRTFAAGLWVLLGSALLLLIGYLVAGKYTVCYRCRAAFYDSPNNPNHHGHDPAIAEKYPPPLPATGISKDEDDS